MTQKIYPTFIYGTAWKEERTESLVILALENGFKAIDTANQRKHYDEIAVGKALKLYLEKMEVSREDLFVQTKFTHISGQDNRIPYDAHSDISTQVEQSFNSSLDHLNTKYIDSYILHGPLTRIGLSQKDWQAWKKMEEIYGSGKTKAIGISNVNIAQLEELCTHANIPPAFVQNRCYASQRWDSEIRVFCQKNGIYYQGFSLLTANTKFFENPVLSDIAQKYECSIKQIIFRFFQNIGAIPLTGTTNPQHMSEDLNIGKFQLSPQEVASIERISSNVEKY